MFLQILCGNHLSYAVALNNLCDLENEVKVTCVEGGPCLALVLLRTIMVTIYQLFLVTIYQLFLQMLSGNHLSHVVALNDLCELEN